MKASCLQDNAQRALQITSRVIPARTTMPIVQNTLIRAIEKELEFTATNLEMTVRIRIPAGVEQEGALTVPNKLLSDLVNTLPSDLITLERVEESAVMRLRCGQSKVNINGAEENLFPPTPEVQEEHIAIITAAEFRKSVSRVAYCANSDEGQPVLTGVLMELEEETLTTVGADGFRMAVQKSRLETSAERKIKALVPARTLLEVQRISGNAERQVEIRIPEDGRNIQFLVGSEEPGVAEVEVTSLLLAGNYPNYRTLIPQDLPNRAVFSLSDLLRTTRRAEVFARGNNHQVRFELNLEAGGAGSAVVTSEAKELGNNRAVLTLEEIKGSNISIALNGKYIQEALASLNSKQVTLETSNSNSLAKLGIPDNDEYTHVMMPIVTLGEV